MRRHPVILFLSTVLLVLGQTCPAALAEDTPTDLNFKVYSPPGGKKAKDKDKDKDKEKSKETAKDTAKETAAAPEETKSTPAADDSSLWSTGSESSSTSTTPASDSTEAAAASTSDSTAGTESSAKEKTKDASSVAGKTLQGYIRVVPSGTKIPIIMDTAVDSDTSQEGDEFAARTGEDLNIDGSTIVPAGSVIKGRIAQLNAPKNMNRSGSVGLKFDTVTTPDNRQIPIVANLVARGGVVHARRGMKDLAIDTGTMAVPSALGVGIGVLAGNASTTGITASSGAIIGAAVGAGVGIAVLMIKKGKKVDVRPGDELKIELAEDLRMPM